MYMYLHQEGTVEQNPKHAGVFRVRVIQILLNSVDSGETIQLTVSPGFTLLSFSY